MDTEIRHDVEELETINWTGQRTRDKNGGEMAFGEIFGVRGKFSLTAI